jgi:hypothetical protein
MSDGRIDDSAARVTQGEAENEVAEGLSGPGAGLGATGRTADEFDPGDTPAGADYNDPGGIDTARREMTGPARAEQAAEEAVERGETTSGPEDEPGRTPGIGR